MPTTAKQRYKDQYTELANRLIREQGWSHQQLHQLKPRLLHWDVGHAVGALRMLLAAKAGGEHAPAILEACWGTLSTLRRAIHEAKRKPTRWVNARRSRPSLGAQIAATESSYAQARRSGSLFPSQSSINELARRYDQRQDEARRAPVPATAPGARSTEQAKHSDSMQRAPSKSKQRALPAAQDTSPQVA